MQTIISFVEKGRPGGAHHLVRGGDRLRVCSTRWPRGIQVASQPDCKARWRARRSPRGRAATLPSGAKEVRIYADDTLQASQVASGKIRMALDQSR